MKIIKKRHDYIFSTYCLTSSYNFNIELIYRNIKIIFLKKIINFLHVSFE